MNFLEETLKELELNNKTIQDIKWIGGESFYITIENFLEIAKQTNYDSGYGGQIIAKDLIIVGDDWWLERHEYDGSEWWEFKTLPIKPNELKEIYSLEIIDLSWRSLQEIQEDYQDEMNIKKFS